jgi:hypothetical protein
MRRLWKARLGGKTFLMLHAQDAWSTTHASTPPLPSTPQPCLRHAVHEQNRRPCSVLDREQRKEGVVRQRADANEVRARLRAVARVSGGNDDTADYRPRAAFCRRRYDVRREEAAASTAVRGGAWRATGRR